MKTPPRSKTPLRPTPPRPTSIGKHSLLICGHQTSISLEDAFWQALKRAAAARGLSVAALVAEIDAGRGGANLSSAIRVYLLETVRLFSSGRETTGP